MSSPSSSHCAMRTGGKKRPELPTNREPRIRRDLRGGPRRLRKEVERKGRGSKGTLKMTPNHASSDNPEDAKVQATDGGNHQRRSPFRRVSPRGKKEEVAEPSGPSAPMMRVKKPKKKINRCQPGEYEVEKIVGVRLRREFYVKWRGYPAEENTWEPEESLVGAVGAIRIFDRACDAARRRRARILAKRQRKKAEASRPGPSVNGEGTGED